MIHSYDIIKGSTGTSAMFATAGTITGERITQVMGLIGIAVSGFLVIVLSAWAKIADERRKQELLDIQQRLMIDHLKYMEEKGRAATASPVIHVTEGLPVPIPVPVTPPNPNP
jgi:hypothetical protein